MKFHSSCSVSNLFITRGSAMALVSRNSATTKHPIWKLVQGLSCGIICVILRLAIFTQYRNVTETHTQTDRQIHDDGMYRA